MGRTTFARLSSLGIGLLAVASVTACNGVTSSGPGAVTTASDSATLSKITDAFKKFHDDTGAWPVGAVAWTDTNRTNPQVDPLQLDTHDTALFTMPQTLKQCSATQAKPCWNGPYLQGKSLGDDAFKDAWGHAHYVSIIRPMDGFGGGVSSAPEGVVVIWSAGPDGTDSVGCTDASCAIDMNNLVKGVASGTPSDDVVTVVAKVRTPSAATN